MRDLRYLLFVVLAVVVGLSGDRWLTNLEDKGGKVIPISNEWDVIGTAENGEKVQIVPLNNLDLDWSVVIVYTSSKPFVVNGKGATCTQMCTLATNWDLNETSPDKIWAEGNVSIEAQSFGGGTKLFMLFIK